jgi:hypothetical protein
MPPGMVPVPTVCGAGGGAAPGLGLAIGRAGIGIVGTAVPGRGAPGVVIMTGGADGAGDAGAAGDGALTGALTPGAALVGGGIGGIGCRGPDRICPGLGGGGAERDGITGPRLTGAPPAPGCPVANGGRNGKVGRTGAGASAFSVEAAGFTGSGAAGGGVLLVITGVASTTRASGCRAGSCRAAGS